MYLFFFKQKHEKCLLLIQSENKDKKQENRIEIFFFLTSMEYNFFTMVC